MTGAARILKALVAKDLAVLAGRRGLWLTRMTFVTAVFAAIAAVWLSVGEYPGVLSELGSAVATAIFAAAYIGSLLAAPAIAAGTIGEERASGMLEILAASPLSNRQILASLLVSRLIAAAYLAVAALPLLAVPLFLGGVGPREIIIRGIPPFAIGTMLAMSYCAWRTAKGESAPRVFRSVLTFVLATPFAPGLLPFRWAVAVSILAIVARFPVLAVYPFWGMGLLTFWPEASGPVEILICIWTVLGLLSAVVFGGRAARALRASASRSSSALPRTERYRYGESHRGERKRALRDLVAGSARDADPAAVSTRLPLLSRTILANVRGIKGGAYRWSRRNPFVAREVLRAPGDDPRGEAFYGWILSKVAIPFVVLISLSVLLMLGEEGRVSQAVQIPLAAALAAALLLLVHVGCGEGARLLPAREAGGLRDILASTPLRGSEVVAGGLIAAALRGGIAVAGALVLIATLAGARLRPLWLPGTLLLVLAVAALGYGTALWMRVFIPKPGQALAAAVGGLGALAVGSAVLLPADSSYAGPFHPAYSPAGLHPLRVLFDAEPGCEIRALAAGLATAIVAIALIGSFALAFDRILGRPRTALRGQA